MEAKEALNNYSNLVAHEAGLVRLLEEKIQELIPSEIKLEIEQLKARFQPKLDDARKDILLLEEDIKEYVVTVGETLKGTDHMFVYAKGRVSWDTKSLEGYAKAHPELLVFRSEGKPSVSVRKVSK